MQPKIPVDKVIGETENDLILNDGSMIPKQPAMQTNYSAANMFQAPPPPAPFVPQAPTGRRIVNEDDVSFTTDDGLRIAKNALTPQRVEELRSQIQAPPLSLNANIPPAPTMMDMVETTTTPPQPVTQQAPQQPVTPNMAMPEVKMPAPTQGVKSPQYILPEVPKNLDEMNAETDRQMAERQQQLNQLADSYAKDISEVTEQLAKPIEPGRYLSNMSTGNKVLAAISLIASGIGSGLTGQQNMAMNVINKAIDEDINAQKAAYDNARSTAQLKNNVYANFKERYQNDIAALQATKMYRLQQVNQAIEARIKASKNEQEIASLNSTLAKNNAEIKKMGIETSLQIRDQMAKEQQALQKPAGEGFYYKGKFIPGKEENYVPGVGTMWTADEAKAGRKLVGEKTAFNKSVDSLINKLENRGSFAKLSIEERDDIQDEVNFLITLGRAFLGSENLNDKDRKLIERLIPNPNDWTTWDARSIRNLQDLKRIVNRNYDARFQSTLKYPDPTTQEALSDFKPE